MRFPDTHDCAYIAEMLASRLIDYSYLQPWADEIIENTDAPPAWLRQLAAERDLGKQLSALGAFINDGTHSSAPEDLDKFHVGCLWLRYERRELSWATVLDQIGKHLDRADGAWDCETPYHYLNCHEDADFSPASEEETKRRYLEDHDLRPWIDLARRKFAPFRSRTRLTKADHSEA